MKMSDEILSKEGTSLLHFIAAALATLATTACAWIARNVHTLSVKLAGTEAKLENLQAQVTSNKADSERKTELLNETINNGFDAIRKDFRDQFKDVQNDIKHLLERHK